MRRVALSIWLDVSPVYWPNPSGISMQIHELAQRAALAPSKVQFVNYLTAKSRLQPALKGVHWWPGARKIDDLLGLSVLGLAHFKSDDVFLATSHYVPRTKAQSWYFLYDLIRVKFPELYYDSHHDEHARLARRLERAAHVVVPSHHTARDMQAMLDLDLPYTVLPAGIDTSWFSRRAETSELGEHQISLPQHYIYSNGVVQDRKRFDWSFRLAAELNLALIVTGALSSDAKTAFAAISRQYPMVQCQHLGLVDRVVQRHLYQGCSLFSFPTLYEGFGMPVLEAMAAGAPIIASDNSSIPEVLDDDEQRFETTDFGEMLTKARRLVGLSLDDKAAMKQRNIVSASKFDINKVASDFWRTVSCR